MNITSSNEGRGPLSVLENIKMRPGMAFGVIIMTALLAFEIFNYSTTDYALQDLLGNLRFAGILWATILSIAFCGIDFAGIARLFTPDQGTDEPKETWYLFGAWLLAATMNAILTWWGVSMAVTNHAVTSSSTVVDQATLTKIVPVFVAVMVWVIRILIIGSLSYAGERIFATTSKSTSTYTPARPAASRPSQSQREPAPAMTMAPRPVVNHPTSAPRPAPSQARPIPPPPEPVMSRPEPTYHSLGARPNGSRPSTPAGDPSDLHH
jgi:hypothetical protein